MIIYEGTKAEFINDVLTDTIDIKIYDKYKSKIGRTTESERCSWKKSMEYMFKVLNR